MDAPVVNIEETYSTGRRSFLTGWIVTRWDGRNETQTVVPVHKGEPDVTVDDDARNDWQSHHTAVRDAIGWAAGAWGIMVMTEWPREEGDVYGLDYTTQSGVRGTYLILYYISVYGALTSRPLFNPTDNGRFRFNQPADEERWSMSSYPSPDTLAKHRKRAILSVSRDERLWEMVFVHPEQEWRFRWNVFVDFLRDGEWGDDWARWGDHLAETGWHPPSLHPKTPMQPVYDYVDGLMDRITDELGIPSAIVSQR